MRGTIHTRRKGQVIDQVAISPRTSNSEVALQCEELERRIKLAWLSFAVEHDISATEARILLLDTGIRLG